MAHRFTLHRLAMPPAALTALATACMVSIPARAQDAAAPAALEVVTITAESFGLEPTEGELVAATRTRYTLRRVDERAGLVHVHFPRIGFTLKAAPAA